MATSTSTEIALIKQAMDFQKKEVAEIKKLLIDFIDSANHTFVTVEKHNDNQKRIEALEKGKTGIMEGILKWLAIAISSAIFSYVVLKIQGK